MGCKCRGDEGQWKKSEITVGCKCREDDVSVGEE